VSIIQIHHASCLDWLAQYAIDHERDPDQYPLFDSCVTDPPYHLTSIVKRFGGKNAAAAKVGATGAYARAARGFMGKEWDGGDIAFRPETWQLVYDVLKPGAHIVAFSGTRTYHRMACAIEDAGFEIRDMLCWHYGSGFPKSHDVSKGIDKAAGAVRPVVGRQKLQGNNKSGGRGGQYANDAVDTNIVVRDEINITAPATSEAEQWQGWGTALKPSTEPICLARKPLSEKTIAANVLKWGTGALNIDATRIKMIGEKAVEKGSGGVSSQDGWLRPWMADKQEVANRQKAAFERQNEKGRWPANILWSAPADEYEMRADITTAERRELMEWIYAKS
jgi:DNA methylase